MFNVVGGVNLHVTCYFLLSTICLGHFAIFALSFKKLKEYTKKYYNKAMMIYALLFPVIFTNCEMGKIDYLIMTTKEILNCNNRSPRDFLYSVLMNNKIVVNSNY